MRTMLDVPPRLCAAILSATLAVSACADGSSTPPPAQFGENPQALGGAYRLDVGDKLKITVFGEDNLSGPAEVNATGQVAMPLAGDIPAKGLSLPQLRDAIARRLADGYINNPKVTVEITSYRPIYVHGEVKNGGEFTFKSGLKFRDAVAMAGGYTYRAQEGYVFLVRDGGQEVRLPMPSDQLVLPGDNIRVPERFF
jgi:polysaccharide export outer membrane protein